MNTAYGAARGPGHENETGSERRASLTPSNETSLFPLRVFAREGWLAATGWTMCLPLPLMSDHCETVDPFIRVLARASESYQATSEDWISRGVHGLSRSADAA